MSEEVDRFHIVRECRNLCAEEGYSGETFKVCVEECIKKFLGK